MIKSFLACCVFVLTAAVLLPAALPAGAAPKDGRSLAYVNSFNYEDQLYLPASDGGHIISVVLLTDGTTIGCVKVFDRLTGMELNGTEFDQAPGATKFWKEEGFNVAEFVVSVRANAAAPAPWCYLTKLKYQIWDHDKSSQNDLHRVWGSVDGNNWFAPVEYGYTTGGAEVHLAK
jgi:hypothetical protein